MLHSTWDFWPAPFINKGVIELVLSNMGILNDTIEEEEDAEGIDDIL
jgi:hypothetical protein